MLNTLLLGQDISEAALFADKVAHIPSFAYSRGWHYIDAADDPPRSCGINMARDCRRAPGCIVSALANHTARILNPALPRWARGQSLRFVLHFVGDVHQPLHTEALARGGNEIAWRRRDEWFDKTRPAESEEEAAFLWALDLFRSDPDARDLSGECGFNPTTPSYNEDDNDDGGIVECVLQWAQEANQYVCDYVLKGGVDAVSGPGVDLGQEYYQGAKDIVDIQIRRAGRRLAKWLDVLAGQWAEEIEQQLVVQN
ncbi:hypothetical protein DV735_g413, partial [Chaetothyriales sp. CBS 134920]